MMQSSSAASYVEFYDANSACFLIYGLAAGFAFITASAVNEYFGFIPSIISAVSVFFVLLHRGRRNLKSVLLRSGKIEFLTLGKRHIFDSCSVKSCKVYGLCPCFMFYVILRVDGLRWPLIFTVLAMQTSCGGYGEAKRQLEQMFAGLKERGG